MEKVKKNPHSWQNSRACTGTGQRCIGTDSVLFFCFGQCSYFHHNLLIYDPIRVIQVNVKIDFKEN